MFGSEAYQFDGYCQKLAIKCPVVTSVIFFPINDEIN